MNKHGHRKPRDRALTILFLAFAVVVAMFPLLALVGAIAMTADAVRALSALAAALALFGLLAPERLKHWVAEIIGRLPP